MQKTLTVEVSPKTIFTALAIVVGLLIAWKIRTILIALGISVILMSGFAPLVDWLVRQKVNQAVAVGITYLISIGIFALLLFAIVPPLIDQIRLFVVDLPLYVRSFSDYLNNLGLPIITSENMTQILSSRLNDALGNIVNLLSGAVSGFLTFVSIAVFSFYLLLERERIKKNIFVFLPWIPKEETLEIAHSIERQLGAWLRGQLVLMFLVGFTTWVGLTLLRVEFALPLAVIAGLLETIAVIGPIIAAIPALIIVLASGASIYVIIGVTALYILIQQIENYFIVPQVMKGVVGLSPLVTIISILIGGSLFGTIGAAIAVPAAAALQVIAVHLQDHRLSTKKN